jgi:hypothetical protein
VGFDTVSVDAHISEKHCFSVLRAEVAISMLLQNVGTYWLVYMAPQPRRTPSSETGAHELKQKFRTIFQSKPKFMFPWMVLCVADLTFSSFLFISAIVLAIFFEYQSEFIWTLFAEPVKIGEDSQ